MAELINAVLGKARAFVDALSLIPRTSCTAIPHGHFARDYNTLRKLALEMMPHLDERLLGKYVGVRGTSEGEVSQASYVEIEVYARQILVQLDLQFGHVVSNETNHSNSLPAEEVSTKAYDVAAIRKDHNQAYRPWSEQDDEHLKTRFREGATIADLVGEFGRHAGGIRSRLRRLGLDTPPESNQRCIDDLVSPRETKSAQEEIGINEQSEIVNIPVRGCAGCGRPISPERLEVIPEATRCVTCQHTSETAPSNMSYSEIMCQRCKARGMESRMVWRTARDPMISGYFLGCSRFPECRYVDK